jgi:hypothetical protein
MIRWLVGIVVLLLLVFIAAVYVFIPSTLTVSKLVELNCNPNGVDRFLGDQRNSSNWLPATGYRIGAHFSHVIAVEIQNGNSTDTSWVSILSSGPYDTTGLHWVCNLRTGLNPLDRLRQYRRADSLDREMGRILERLRVFVERENVYGTPIRESSTQDSFLIMKRTIFPAYPTIGQLYGLFKQLQDYRSSEGARQTGYPMVNVTPAGKDQFQTMVALPIDRELKANTSIFPRKMVPGKFLVTEVRGGPGHIDAAFTQLQNYIVDHQRTTMAIPFQSLVTDRSQEPDTSRWVTRWYYPIF